MNTTYSGSTELELLKEDALLNIERLFNLWGLKYVRISPDELDFRNPSRIDKNFGAVRFNTKKGFGADFAGVAFSTGDYQELGQGFDRSDYDLPSKESIRYGFDIVGLCQRINECNTYKDGARLLKKQLQDLDRQKPIEKASLDASIKRNARRIEEIQQRIDYAGKILKFTKDYRNTLGETYLKSRCLELIDHEPVIRFHPAVLNKEANRALPCLVFKIQPHYEGEIKGIHRVYLKDDGSGKADISNQKMALGEAKKNAIWFGSPNKLLYISEGPENALTLRSLGAKFVACAIFAGNMSDLEIPPYVEKIIICPDRDKAGINAAEKCIKKYKPKFDVKVHMPKKILMKNGKYADLNDLLCGVTDDRQSDEPVGT